MMKNTFKLFFISLALLLANTLSAADWNSPRCNRVVATRAITFTKDQGFTLVPTVGKPLRGIIYTPGLVALDTPNHLLAASSGKILQSRDAGCTWIPLATVPEPYLNLTAAPGGIAYGWRDNGAYLIRIQGREVRELRSPVTYILGLGTDRRNGNHLRLGGSDGDIWDSTDGGNTWQLLEPLKGPNQLLLIYRVAFDPNDLNHILIGLADTGALVTFDGAGHWATATGFTSLRGQANAFNVVISPADSNVVWAMAIDLDDLGRHIYRSDDGGQTFSRVIDASADVTLINGPLMAADPQNKDVLYFVFGTFFANYGTDLFRYDFGANQLTKTHNNYDGIDAIAFNPASSSILYLGLENIEGIF